MIRTIMSPYFNQKGPRVGEVVWEMINFAVLIEAVLVTHFCLSFHKNKKAFPIARQKFKARGTGDIQSSTLVPSRPCSPVQSSLCVCVGNAG